MGKFKAAFAATSAICLLASSAVASATSHLAIAGAVTAGEQRERVVIRVADDAKSVAPSQPSNSLPVVNQEPPTAEECKLAMDWLAVEKCLPFRRRVLFTKGVKPGYPQKVSGAREVASPAPLLRSLPSLNPTPAEEAEYGKARAMQGLDNDRRLNYEQNIESLSDFLRSQ